MGYHLLLLLVLPALAVAHIQQLAASGTQPSVITAVSPTVADVNAAIAAQAEAATAAGQPAKWLITFKAPEQQVQDQAQIISQSAAVELPVSQAQSIARQQVYGAIKSRVLGAAVVAPSSAAVTQEAGAAQQVAVQVINDYSHMPIMFASISSAAELARLRSHPDVVSVVPDGVARPQLMAGLSLIGQPAVVEQGLVGTGTVVVVDSGLDYTRAAFGPCTAPGVPAATCKVAVAKDLAPADNMLDDPQPDIGYHGTNVAGIVAGVAPGVKLISLDVFDGTSAYFSTLVDAVNWAVANKDMYNITAINLSLGAPVTDKYPCAPNPLSLAVNTAFAAGIPSAAAAGNNADKQQLLIPACAAKAVSVGAVYSEAYNEYTSFKDCSDVPNPPPDLVACFSNSAPELTLLAPGCSIFAAGVMHTGTSQATPFVSAALAILRGRYPTYTLAQLISVLTSTGTPVTDPGNQLVKPRLNLRAAAGLNCALTVSPRSLKAPNTGGTLTLQITPGAPDCTWSVGTPNEPWLRVVGATSGTGPGSITLQVNPATTAARSTGLVVSAARGAAAAAVLVSQAVTDAATAAADKRAPTMGRLQGTSTGSSVTLTWPAARDTQSGVSSYKVVYNQGSRPPQPRCVTGTPVEQQPSTAGTNKQLTVTGLSAGSRYTFRVCALDAAGNVATGSSWRSSASG